MWIGVVKAREGMVERIPPPSRAVRLDGLRDNACDVAGVSRAVEIDEPYAVPDFALQYAHRLEREPALSYPGGPVSVTSLCSRTSCSTSARSLSRPTKDVTGAGRLPRRRGGTGTGAIAASCARIAC